MNPDFSNIQQLVGQAGIAAQISQGNGNTAADLFSLIFTTLFIPLINRTVADLGGIDIFFIDGVFLLLASSAFMALSTFCFAAFRLGSVASRDRLSSR